MIELHQVMTTLHFFCLLDLNFKKNDFCSSPAVMSRTTARGAAPIGYLGHGAHGGLQDPDVVFSYFVTWYVENRQILASGRRHTMIDGVLQTIEMLLKLRIIWKYNCCKTYYNLKKLPPPPPPQKKNKFIKRFLFLDLNQNWLKLS